MVQARGANAPGVEGIPLVAALAEPFVFFAGRPAAERAVGYVSLMCLGFAQRRGRE